MHPIIDFFNMCMKKNTIILLLTAFVFSSCGSFTNLYKHKLKERDYDYMYEAAKEYYMAGQYEKSIQLLNDVITIMKGSDRGEESVYMLGMSYLKNKEYDKTYHCSYAYTQSGILREKCDYDGNDRQHNGDI